MVVDKIINQNRWFITKNYLYKKTQSKKDILKIKETCAFFNYVIILIYPSVIVIKTAYNDINTIGTYVWVCVCIILYFVPLDVFYNKIGIQLNNHN